MIILRILRLAESLLSYEPQDRFLHRLNPLTKLAFLLVVIGAGVYLSSPTVPWYCIFGIFVVLALACTFGGVNLGKELRERWPYVAAVVGILLIGNLVFAPRSESTKVHVYFALPPFTYITNLSLNYAIEKSLFVLTSLTAVIMVLKSTRLADLNYALTRVGVPYAIAQIISTSLRCIPMVVDGLLIVYNAQRARGFELEAGGVRKRIAQWRALILPLFVVLLKWIDMMALVFQARGLDFAFGKQRTHLRPIPFSYLDVAGGVIGVGGVLGLVYLVAIGSLHV
jgi:energy-coupling factor transport system permease protein